MLGLVDKGAVGDVQKWDKRGVDGLLGVDIPKLALSGVGFSKTGQRDKLIDMNRWEVYPLFKRQRLLLLVFLLF